MRKLCITLMLGFGLALPVIVHAGDWIGLGPDIGTVTALAAHPTEPAVAVAGTRTGGIFRTTDGGESWVHVGLRGLDVYTIEYSPADPSMVFVGIARESSSSVPDGGIYRSDDGGVTWGPARSGLEDPDDSPGSPHRRYFEIYDIATDVTDPSIAWAATYDGLFSTADAGRSWNHVPHLGTRMILSVEATSTEPAEVFVSSLQYGVRCSTDGGQTWDFVNDGLGYVFQGLTRLHRPFVMVESSWQPGALLAQADDSYPFLFDPETRQWARLPLRVPIRGPYPFTRWITDIAVGAPGSRDVWLATGWSGVIHSSDGGQSWANTDSTGIDCRHGSDSSDESFRHLPRIVVFAGNGERLLAAVEERGIVRSRDRGWTWSDASHGLNTASPNSIIVDTDRPERLVVATAGHGLHYTEDRGQAWWEVLSHQLQPCSLLDPIAWSQPPRICWRWGEIRVGFNGEYLARGECGFYSSSNRGATWQEVDESMRWPLGHSRDHRIRFVVGGQGVLRSDDHGASWQECGELPNARFVEIRRDYSIVVQDSAPEVVLANWSGRLFRSGDGCRSWSEAAVSVGWLAAHPSVPGRFFVGNRGGLWQTTDEGETWSVIGLEGLHVKQVIFDPDRPGVMYAAVAPDPYDWSNFHGVMISLNGGTNWRPLGQSLYGRAVNTLTLHPDGAALFAGVANDGVFRLELQPWHFERDYVQVLEIE